MRDHKLPRATVVHVVQGVMQASRIEPEASEEITLYHYAGLGFQAEVFNLNANRMIAMPMSSVRCWGTFDERAERVLFEHAMLAHYLDVRARRALRGSAIAFDTERARSPRELFERTATGEYVAVVYQAAWSGWKMSRGVL